MRWLGPLLALLLVAGCAELAKSPDESRPAPGNKPAPALGVPKMRSDTLKYLASRNLKPQPTRPLNVRSRCTNKDGGGTRTRLNLLVKEAEVRTFDAEIAMKGRGSCRFRLADFDQIERLPQALLRNKRDPGCLVRMWEEGPRVTIAFNSCPQSCERDAFDYLWPIMVEAKSGRCF